MKKGMLPLRRHPFFMVKIFLHFGNGNAIGRTHAKAALAENALGALVWIALAVCHLEYFVRANVYTLLATFTLLGIYSNHVHPYSTSWDLIVHFSTLLV
jgi:hypothetical protein